MEGQRVLSARTLPICLPGRGDRSSGRIVRYMYEHVFVYGPAAPSAVILFHRMGLSRKAIAGHTGISIRTISRWCRSGPPLGSAADVGTRHRRGPKPGRSTIPSREVVLSSADLGSYSYLLGIYLGDGHITAQHRGVYELRISMDSRYPGLIGETVRAARAVLPRNRVYVKKHPVYNVVMIGCASKALPTLFPQHGPGRKHSRQIELARWQESITFVHAEELIRGLIHSDGCRFVARQRRLGRIYCYSRYCFSNRSRDIMRIFCQHLDLLGIHWTLSDAEQAQIARREAVQALDEFVGPKR